MLAEAGYPDGGFSLSLYVGDNNQERIRVSQVVSAALEELGITVECQPNGVGSIFRCCSSW
ncbi:MAG: hypothetical protein ACLSIL_15230 [Enterococcus casseliflavus]